MGIPIAFLFGYPKFLYVAVLMAPMVIDGFAQLLTPYQSGNIRRLITGILFGVAFVFLLIYFHRTCVHIAGAIVMLFVDDTERVRQAMELFL